MPATRPRPTQALRRDPPPRALRRDPSRQAAPQVLEHLRERILTLQLRPGTLLSRVALAAEYGLSQTPIRDALMKLAEEGLVDVFPQHATVVSRIDLASAHQAHFLRLAIESEVVRVLASAPDPELLARLRAQIDVQTALLGREAFRTSFQADGTFHRLMYEAAAVPDLFEMVRRRSGHVDRLRLLHLPTAGKERRILRDHRAILDAIAAGDPAAAQARLREHLSGTLSQVEKIRRAWPDYFKPVG